MKLTLAMATKLLDAAEEEALRIGAPMALAVVDAGGSLVAFRRMDGASLIAGATVPAKARTAVYFGKPTAEVLERARIHPRVYQSFLTAADEALVYSMGGLPVVVDGTIAGGVGASGGTGEEDIQVAEAALRALADEA